MEKYIWLIPLALFLFSVLRRGTKVVKRVGAAVSQSRPAAPTAVPAPPPPPPSMTVGEQARATQRRSAPTYQAGPHPRAPMAPSAPSFPTAPGTVGAVAPVAPLGLLGALDDRTHARRAIVLAEILGPPVALR